MWEASTRIGPVPREGVKPDEYGEADDGVRTRDPQLGKLMLYQLSYVRAWLNDSASAPRVWDGSDKGASTPEPRQRAR
jgi:hypothetical protein